MKTTKKFIILALLAATAWVLLNFNYFRENIEYELRPETQKEEQEQNETPKAMGPDQLLIPSLEISAPIKYAAQADENHFQDLLINGVVHYPGTAPLGQIGNAYIFGHSSDNAWSTGHFKTIFATLPKMEIGDEILVTDGRGQTYRYKVIEKQIVANNDFSVLSQDTDGKKLLTLQTSYPIGTSLQRYVVIAELAE